ncbi:hypothetical protein KIPB_006892 [Kipferlia bialata]|uniref:Uncharacterized protein n=1 Tax=Kipferlia bialata TaxID=797122 RepID=A0A9K3CZY3_9EUKA|nr:hypothetical protein KIPB_006892 [Kipferlia bialata]|eukprot:g6892.t1
MCPTMDCVSVSQSTLTGISASETEGEALTASLAMSTSGPSMVSASTSVSLARLEERRLKEERERAAKADADDCRLLDVERELTKPSYLRSCRSSRGALHDSSTDSVASYSGDNSDTTPSCGDDEKDGNGVCDSAPSLQSSIPAAYRGDTSLTSISSMASTGDSAGMGGVTSPGGVKASTKGRGRRHPSSPMMSSASQYLSLNEPSLETLSTRHIDRPVVGSADGELGSPKTLSDLTVGSPEDMYMERPTSAGTRPGAHGERRRMPTNRDLPLSSHSFRQPPSPSSLPSPTVGVYSALGSRGVAASAVVTTTRSPKSVLSTSIQFPATANGTNVSGGVSRHAKTLPPGGYGTYHHGHHRTSQVSILFL